MTPPAPIPSGGRFDAEGDEIAQRFFSPSDLRLSPEVYVARHGHTWGCFSFHLYRYHDPALGAWVRQVGELLSADDEAERCRRQFLSPEELATVRRQQAEDF